MTTLQSHPVKAQSRFATAVPGEVLLREAIRRKTPLVISVRAQDGWKTFRSHFLSADVDRPYLAIAPLFDTNGANVERVLRGKTIGVTFRHGHKKCMFATAYVGTPEPSAGDSSKTAMLLEWPDQLHQFQRRVYYRVTPPDGQRILAQVTTLPGVTGTAGPSRDTLTFTGQIEDLSAGGIRLGTSVPCRLREGDTVMIAFAASGHGTPVELEATFKHEVRKNDQERSLGFQFVGLETTPRGRQTLIQLARIVTDLYRAGKRKDLSRRRNSR